MRSTEIDGNPVCVDFDDTATNSVVVSVLRDAPADGFELAVNTSAGFDITPSSLPNLGDQDVVSITVSCGDGGTHIVDAAATTLAGLVLPRVGQ